MSRAMLGCGVVLWAGAALLLTCWRRVVRVSPADRLAAYSFDGSGLAQRRAVSDDGWRGLAGPASRAAGDRLARLFGVQEEAALRLARIHSPLDVIDFRLRQLGACVLAVGVGAAIAAGLWRTPLLASLVTFGAPLLAFLVQEQRLATASAHRQARVARGLPVVVEQLALLVGAGYSVGGAVQRLAARGRGPVAEDLRRVTARVRQGVAVEQALAEWAEVVQVSAVGRVVELLRRSSEVGDLGRLLSDEARTIRHEAHAATTALLERRAQQVWVPVTVATLVPGVVFIAIPFVEALRLFTGP